MTTRVGSLLRLTAFMVAPLATALVSVGAAAQTIKIGEINSYKSQPAFLGPYKNGWNMALDEVNAAGVSTARSWKSSHATTTATPGTPCAWRRNW